MVSFSGLDFDQPHPIRIRSTVGGIGRLDVGTSSRRPLSRRFVWRVDVSDIITFYPNKTVTTGDTPVAQGSFPASNMSW